MYIRIVGSIIVHLASGNSRRPLCKPLSFRGEIEAVVDNPDPDTLCNYCAEAMEQQAHALRRSKSSDAQNYFVDRLIRSSQKH